jgi:hypothetical protein
MEKTFKDDNIYPLFNNCTWRMSELKYRNNYLLDKEEISNEISSSVQLADM